MKFLSKAWPTAAKIACGWLLFGGWLAVFVFSPFARFSAGAQSVRKAAPDVSAETEGGGYVIQVNNGRTLCREAATATEENFLRRSEAKSPLRILYGAGNTALVQRQAQQQTGLRITLRATGQLDGAPEAKAAFVRAAQTWESLILTPISIVIDVDYGPTFFGESYPNSNTLGATAQQAVGSPTIYPAVRSALLNGVSSTAETTLYNALPNAQVPTDQGNLTYIATSSVVFRALGVLNPVANPEAEQQQLGAPPRIGFNSNFPFDFNPDDGISPTRFDFDAIATHEIGHVLGFSSFVGVKERNPSLEARLTALDIFRFRPGATLDAFPTAQRILASGGDQIFFGGGAELALSTGRDDGSGGDGNQASHWKADELTGRYIGIMDPTAAAGQREVITDNDRRAFDTLGYRIRSSQQQLNLAQRSLDFGGVAVGASADRPLTIGNTGGQPLRITGITSSNARFTLVSPNTPFTIPANGQQDIVLRFAPAANGAQSATLTIASDDLSQGTANVSLTGFGGALPQVALASGAAQNGSLPVPVPADSCVLDNTQYTINVPANTSQLRITLSGNQDLDLYARFGQRIGLQNDTLVSDHKSDSPNNTETITVTPSSTPTLRAGTYFIGVTNCGPGAANYTVTATVGGAAGALAAVSAASFRGEELASEAIAAAFGQGLATGREVARTVPLPTSLLGTSVRVRDSAGGERLASLFFVSAEQVNFQIPLGTATGAATITVTSGSGAVSVGAINIVRTAPGLLSVTANGQGLAAANALRVRANGAQIFESVARFDTAQNRFVAVPIDFGADTDQMFLVLYGTGIRGRTSTAGVTGLVGGLGVSASFAGAQGSQIGLDQVNVRLPRSLAGRGEVDVVLTVDGKTANTVRVAFR